MSEPEAPMDEIARLLAVLVRKSFDTQTETILAMSKSGLGSSRIAQLLGTTSNTVNVTLQQAKRK